MGAGNPAWNPPHLHSPALSFSFEPYFRQRQSCQAGEGCSEQQFCTWRSDNGDKGKVHFNQRVTRCGKPLLTQSPNKHISVQVGHLLCQIFTGYFFAQAGWLWLGSYATNSQTLLVGSDPLGSYQLFQTKDSSRSPQAADKHSLWIPAPCSLGYPSPHQMLTTRQQKFMSLPWKFMRI